VACFPRKIQLFGFSAYLEVSPFQLIRKRGVLLYGIPYSTTSHMLSLRRCPSPNTKDEISLMCCLLKDIAQLCGGRGASVSREQWWNGGAAEGNKRNLWKRLHLNSFVKHRCLKVIQDWTHSYKSPSNWMGESAAPVISYRLTELERAQLPRNYIGKVMYVYYSFTVYSEPCCLVA
jgi:hypothetical protein